MRINETQPPLESLGEGVKLFIGVPSYDGKMCHQFTTSLINTVLDLKEHGVLVQIDYAIGDCFIDRARNMLAQNFMKSDCTHFLQIDADQGWNPEAVYKMIEKDKEFICGAVPIRDPDKENYALSILVNQDMTPQVSDGLLIAEHIGTAFMMVKRCVLEKMQIKLPKIRRLQLGMDFYSYFEACYNDQGGFRGEDATFCYRWGSLGGLIFIYPDIDFVHLGAKEWKGNYHKYLLNQPQPSENKGVSDSSNLVAKNAIINVEAAIKRINKERAENESVLN